MLDKIRCFSELALSFPNEIIHSDDSLVNDETAKCSPKSLNDPRRNCLSVIVLSCFSCNLISVCFKSEHPCILPSYYLNLEPYYFVTRTLPNVFFIFEGED